MNRRQLNLDSNMGPLGLSTSIGSLASRHWDAVVVGAGHNGLACAAALARGGRSVLVLEARERIGGACTFEERWPGCRVSPCAYLCGLLHPAVIDEFDLVARGLEWTPAEAGMFVPFSDGEAVQLWEDPARCEEEIRRIAPQDLAGWRAMSNLVKRLRDRLRPPDESDLWLNPFPEREDIEARIGNDEEARALLFSWSMADYLDRYLSSERLHTALMGQGVIGTNASPFDPGTASIHFHHSSGRMFGQAGMWGTIKGGMGTVSFLLADAAREADALIATGAPVSRIVPGQGVEMEGGEHISASCVVSNADPVTTCALLSDSADAAWAERVNSIPMEGCTVKATLWMSALPDFHARPGTDEVHHRGQVNTPLEKGEWKAAYAAARKGELPERLWTELYFQTACDDSLAPRGTHLVSVFAQYVPYAFSSGSWDDRRGEAGQLILETLGAYCRNIPGAVLDMDVLGPPDIEERVGLRGGHIFQGECLPEQMWDRRLTCRTPMEGVYLCGAGTHPGGSVIGVNGLNAARVVLTDSGP